MSMETNRVWSVVLSLSLLAVLIAVAQMAVNWHKHDLNISAYIDCLTKWQIAKNSGRIPKDVPLPSGGEVCARFK
jgi:hypothetical protein